MADPLARPKDQYVLIRVYTDLDLSDDSTVKDLERTLQGYHREEDFFTRLLEVEHIRTEPSVLDMPC